MIELDDSPIIIKRTDGKYVELDTKQLIRAMTMGLNEAIGEIKKVSLLLIENFAGVIMGCHVGPEALIALVLKICANDLELPEGVKNIEEFLKAHLEPSDAEALLAPSQTVQ